MENYGSANVSLYYGNELTGENALINIKEKAEQYDAVILTLGNSPQFENENFNINLPGFYQGDRTSIEFPTAQQRLIESLSQIKPPTILLIKSGGPISSPFAEDNIDAIVQLWYDGQEGGNATADILFGEANPSGKLPLTIYKRTTDLPEFTDYSMANRTYKYFEGEVLYPFGFGLSYTNFAYDSISISDKSVDICNDLSVNVDFKLSNIGKYDGSEVAQLYIRNVSSKRQQPIKQLKGFQKQFLRIGESKNISIKLNLKDLYYWDELINDYNYEPGLYEIQIGKSSADIMLLDTLFMDNCSTNVVHHTLNEDSFIYPNPASDNIILDLSKYNDKIHVIEIYNILGVKVRFVDNIPAESSYTFNIRELSSSTYYVKIFGQNQSYTVKFVKN